MSPARCVSATYRLQLTRDFPFSAARALVPYFERLGVSHLYLSPVLAARRGSTHGYDVVDHARVNPELGTEAELRALAEDLHSRGMGIILDIVPNHMAASEENPYWDDLLEHGEASRYFEWFDVDWNAPHAGGKVVLPVLGDPLDDVLQRRELKIRVRDSGSRLAYFDKTFPLDAATLPKEIVLAQLDPSGRQAVEEWAAGSQGKKRLRDLMEAQHYRLTFWRRAADEVNYRRFFEINDLVSMRMEADAIFDATHKVILAWVRDGVIDGLRIDHIDGLRFPSWYLAKLRTAVDSLRHSDASERFPIFVEKILVGDEKLPTQWMVDGTTGYDFMNDVEDLFLEPHGYAAIEANYRRLRRSPSLQFADVARDSKRHVLHGGLRADVKRIARAAHAWRGEVSVDDLVHAIVESIVHLAVYRTYVSEPGLVSDADRHELSAAFRLARKRHGVNPRAVSVLEGAFFLPPAADDTLRTEIVMLFQQTSGPATAKGVEDTALYVYVPLVSRNEVGGKPYRPLRESHQRLHERNALRAREWPRTLLATNTHDTKRSADVRSRLDALTIVPDEWTRHLARWRRLNKKKKKTVRGRPAPDTNAEYLYYQTLLGLWPAPRPHRRVDDLPDRVWLERARDRLVAYMHKAVRESKTRTSWTESDALYERAVESFVRGSLDARDDAPFLPDVARLTAHIADPAFQFALARVLLHLTAPGVPDLYQGDELWNFTLVDPDNRRPVDFQRRARLVQESERADLMRDTSERPLALCEDVVKLALIARLLRCRREHARLFLEGEYIPLLMESADATRAQELFAFARRTRDEVSIAIARTRVVRAGRKKSEPVSRALSIAGELAGRWRSILTDRDIELVRVGDRVSVRSDEILAPNQPCELLLRTNP